MAVIWSSLRKHAFVIPLSPVFPEDNHTFCSLRGFSLAVGNQTVPSPFKLTNFSQFLPKTCLSALPQPKDQVPRACGAGWGCASPLSWMKTYQEAGETVCPFSPFYVSLCASCSAALEPHGDSLYLQAQEGQFLRLLCAADSRPPATLSWALEDRVLSWSHSSGSRGLELELPRVKPADAGHYTCRAENRLGFQNRTLNLSVQCECGQQGPISGRREGEGAGAGGRILELEGTWNPAPGLWD